MNQCPSSSFSVKPNNVSCESCSLLRRVKQLVTVRSSQPHDRRESHVHVMKDADAKSKTCPNTELRALLSQLPISRGRARFLQGLSTSGRLAPVRSRLKFQSIC